MSISWVRFLGTSAGTPTPESWFPSILVFHGGVYLLLDAGEGAQIRLLEVGVGPPRIDVIAITHMHGDHVFGLPGLVQTMAMSARERELVLVGPSGLEEFMSTISRLTSFEPGFPIVVREPPTRIDVSRGSSKLVVEPFRVCHTGEAYGYRVTGYVRAREGDRRRFSLAYTGDTRPCSDYVDSIRGVDLLIHDSTFTMEKHGREVWEYGHSTAMDAADVARRVGAGALVLFHKSVRYRGVEEELVAEAKKLFPNTILARDGLTIYL